MIFFDLYVELKTSKSRKLNKNVCKFRSKLIDFRKILCNESAAIGRVAESAEKERSHEEAAHSAIVHRQAYFCRGKRVEGRRGGRHFISSNRLKKVVLKKYLQKFDISMMISIIGEVFGICRRSDEMKMI